jgi:hypothetical protein
LISTIEGKWYSKKKEMTSVDANIEKVVWFLFKLVEMYGS